MDCSTHAHFNFLCPQTNGRHSWEKDFKKETILELKDDFTTKIGLPIKCIYCGAYGIDWYIYQETVEGE